MFPACQTAGEGWTIPTCDVVPSDGEGCMAERWECQAAVHDCCARRAPRAHCFDSLVGPWRPLARKSIEPRALQGEGGTLRGLQRFIRDGHGDEEQRRWHAHPIGADEMGAPDGVRMSDETGCRNKGKDSVGVARQSGGSLGQGEHGPVGGGPGRPLGMAMPGWTSAASCLQCGFPTRMPPAGPQASSPRPCPGTPNRRGRRRGDRLARRRASCRARPWWPMVSRALGPPCSTLSRPVGASPRAGQSPQRRAAGVSAPSRKTSLTRPRAQRAQSGRGGPPTTCRVPCPPPAGIAGRDRQAPRGRSQRPWPADA